MLNISKAAMLAAALSLSAVPSIGLTVAAAEDAASPVTPAVPELGFKLSIPTIVAVGSSMDESAIRDALSGNFLAHVDELSKLTATSITIPEITLTTTATVEGKAQESTATYHNLVLSNVKDGVAESVSMDGAESKAEGTTFGYGKLDYSNWNIASTFAFLGLVPGQTTEFGPILSTYKIEGATFTAPGFSCKIGPWSGEGSKARPATVLLKDVIAAGQEMQKTPNNPPTATIKTVVTYVTDILTGIESSPTTIGGLDCSGDIEGKPVSFGFGNITVGNFESGIYPTFTLTNFHFDGGEVGKLSLDKAEIKRIDFNPPVAALRADLDTLDVAWFDKNARKLVPSFEGLDFSGLSLDFPDPEASGARIQATLKDFDLTLSNYVNGIPTKVSSKTEGLDIPLPAETTDPQMQALLALGLKRISLNYDIAAGWDKASNTLTIDKVAVSGNDLGSIAIAAVIGNATEQLFDIDPNVEQVAATGVTLKSIKLDLGDAGLADLAVPMIAGQQGADPTTFRQQMAATAEGAAIAMLGSSDSARAVGKALSDFISGAKKNVSVTVTSKDPAGLPVPLLMQSQNDPSVLQSAVDVSATAE